MKTNDAGSAPLERVVRPGVWMVRRHDAPTYWIPFLHDPVDALKDPEREVVRLHWPDDIAAELALKADAEIESLRAALKISEEYIARRVLGTGGHGETKILPAIRAALAVGAA